MRVLLPSLVFAAACCLTAAPAEAKAGLEVSAVPVSVGAVPTDEVSVTAGGGDDAAGYQRLCLQQAEDDAWRTLACGPVGFGDGGTVQAFVQRAPSQDETFRAELQRMARSGDRDVVQGVDLTSAPVRLPAAGAAGLDAGDGPLLLDGLDLVGLVLQR
jgi:hypothetical protein